MVMDPLPAHRYLHSMGVLSDHLSAQFRQLRRRLNLTQEALAEMTGLSQSEVSRLETGSWGSKMERAERVLVELGIDPRDLLAAGPGEAGVREAATLWSEVDNDTKLIVLTILRREARRNAEQSTKTA